jgi:phosphoserine phosphatase
MPPAAIFDLDRTLITGWAGPILARHLREVGPTLPLVDPYNALSQRLAHTWMGPQLIRAMARAAKGWPVDLVAKAAEGSPRPNPARCSHLSPNCSTSTAPPAAHSSSLPPPPSHWSRPWRPGSAWTT